MTTRRRSDPSTSGSHYRSDRLQQEGGRWYFYTREGTLEGPFEDKVEALEALDRYIAITNLKLIEPDSKLSISESS